MKKLFFMLVVFFFGTSLLYSGLNEIYNLGFTEEESRRIVEEMRELLRNPEKTDLDLSGLSAPDSIDAALKEFYCFLYPFISDAGPIKNKDYVDVHLTHLDLSGNKLTDVPTFVFDFPDLATVDFTLNSLPKYRKVSIILSRGRIHFTF